MATPTDRSRRDDMDEYGLAPDPDEPPARTVRRPPATAAGSHSPAGGGQGPGPRKVQKGVARSTGTTRTGPPSALEAGAAFAAGRRNLSKETHDSNARRQVRMLAITAAAALVIVVGIIIGVRTLRSGGGAGPLLGDDEQARKLISQSGYEEIRSWLSQGHDRTLMGHTPTQSTALADRLYDLGASEVLAGGGRMSMHVVVSLPEEKQQRTALIDWLNNWNETYAPRPKQTDLGQQYLVVQMPINR